MALDPDTVARLSALRDVLTSQQQGLQAQAVYIGSLKATLANAGLTMDELLAMKETVFSELPAIEQVHRDLERVSTALAGLKKLI